MRMALVLQNRAEPELREILDKFLKAMEFQHEIPVDYNVMAICAHHVIESKVQKHLGDWLNELSIPELMRIKKMCIEATQHIQQSMVEPEPASEPETKPDKKTTEKNKKKTLQ